MKKTFHLDNVLAFIQNDGLNGAVLSKAERNELLEGKLALLPPDGAIGEGDPGERAVRSATTTDENLGLHLLQGTGSNCCVRLYNKAMLYSELARSP